MSNRAIPLQRVAEIFSFTDVFNDMAGVKYSGSFVRDVVYLANLVNEEPIGYSVFNDPDDGIQAMADACLAVDEYYPNIAKSMMTHIYNATTVPFGEDRQSLRFQARVRKVVLLWLQDYKDEFPENLPFDEPADTVRLAYSNQSPS